MKEENAGQSGVLRELVVKNRTCRRFHQNVAVTASQLRELVNLGRLSASGGNKQPLKYLLSWTPEKNDRIFPHLQWAGYLKDWDGPADGERPAGYVVILCDREVSLSPGCDHGLAAQSIMLGATEMGLAGCIMGAVDRPRLREVFGLPERYDILLVLALGKPRETIVIEPVKDGRIAYWRDEKGFHHVPKRALSDVILEG